MTPPLPPAGWYSDPDPQGTGLLRYWDGTAWTEQLAPIPTGAAEPGALPEYASFGRRALAFLGDAAIMLVLGGWFARVVHWAYGTPWWTAILTSLVAAVTWFSYQWFSVRRWRATPGMRLLGLSVRYLDSDSDKAILRRSAVFGAVFGLSFILGVFGQIGLAAASVVGILFAIGCISMGRPLGQTWHDRWSRTQIRDNRNVRTAVDGEDEVGLLPPLTTFSRNLIVTLIGIGLLLNLIYSLVGLPAALDDLDDLLRQLPADRPY